MTDPDLSQCPLVAKGHAFEDFAVGQTFEHHWGRTLSAGDNSLFTTVTQGFTPLYFNAEFARAHGHPDVVVHPLLVLCTIVGLSVEDLSEAGGPFLGVNDVAFLAPVYPGDTLTARSEVLGARASEAALAGAAPIRQLSVDVIDLVPQQATHFAHAGLLEWPALLATLDAEGAGFRA